MHLPEGKYEVVAIRPGYRETKMVMVIKCSELVSLVVVREIQ
jgi:hypothetical protein